MCVSTSPYSLYTLILHTLVERLPPHAPVKWKQIKKSHKRIDEDKRISLFQKRVSYLSPILCFQSQTFISIRPRKPHHGTRFQNRVIESPFYDFGKSIFKNWAQFTRLIYQQTRRFMLNPNLYLLLTRNVWLVR